MLSIRESCDLATHIGSKWRDGKRYLMQIKTKRAGVAILWEKIDFRSKIVTRDKESHYIMMKELIH